MRNIRHVVGAIVTTTLLVSAVYLSVLLPMTESTTVEAVAVQPASESKRTSVLKDIIESVEKTMEIFSVQIKETQVTNNTPTQQPVAARPIATAPTPKQTAAYDRISIPSIGLDSSYVGVGLTKDGKIDVPVSTIGRWTGSAEPGTPGAGFYDGHTPGVFSSLSRLSVGARITITTKTGKVYHYKIVHRETVPLKTIDMRKALQVHGGASEGLNLMTCAGNYIRSQGTYDARLVIYAVRI